jgi:hypothetical protein
MKEKISIDQLKEIYGVTERTLNNWIRNKDLPVVQISSKKKWVYKEDLVGWEEKFKRSN